MGRKIIFFDVDGTLYGRKTNGVTPKVKETIKRLREKGFLCFIASGRPYSFIAKTLKDVGFDGYVLANGAHIKYQDQDLKIRLLNEDDLKTFIQDLKRKDIQYNLQTSTYCYMEKKQKNLYDFYLKCHVDFENFCSEYDEEEVIKRTIKMELWVKNEEELDYVKSHLQHFSSELHIDHHSMEVYAQDVSKATGLLDVLDYFKIDIKDSYCFGDGPNDIEMFETVAHPIAMGNAIDEVKEKAIYVTTDVDEDGIYNACKHFGWINS